MRGIRPPRPARLLAVVIGAALLAGPLAACGNDTEDSGRAPAGSDEADPGSFPTTIKNTFGKTTIDAEPERIVTLGWSAQDVVYALGEQPVGMPSDSYGATDQHIKPWQTKHFDPDVTTLFDTTDGPPFEEIASLRPDVILAPYEGFDETTYETLSDIAPTVAYPDKPWQTSWQKQTELIGQALGRSDDTDELIQQTEALLDKTARAHPEFAGKTLSVLSLGAENYAYLPGDPRVELLTELGFEDSPGVVDLARDADPSEFAPEVAKESLDSVDADVVVGYATGFSAQQVLDDPVYASLGAFRNDAAYVLDDEQLIGAMSSATVLSVPWLLDRVTPGLAAAAESAS